MYNRTRIIGEDLDGDTRHYSKAPIETARA
jgi:hypothetical protein